MLKKNRVCPLCGRNEPEPLYSKDGCLYARCRSCRLIYVPAVPAKNIHFEEDFFENQELASIDGNPARRERMSRLSGQLRKAFGSRKDLAVLDVGCGKGWNLVYLKKSGYSDVRGIDVNRPALETAAKHGLAVEEGLLEQRAYPAECFDLILMDQVIEHLEDPLPLLKEVRRILKPGGLFWSSVPNVGAWHIRLFLREKHRHFMGEAHLNLFDPSTFARLLRSAGFSVRRIGTYFEEMTLSCLKGVLTHPEDFDHAAIKVSKAKRSLPQQAKTAEPSVRASRRVLRAVIRPVNFLMTKATRLFKAGAYLESVAVKERSAELG